MSPPPRSYSDDWSVPTSFGVWGGTAKARAQLALAVARRIDPNPFWLQIEDPSGVREESEYATFEELRPDHVFYLSAPDLAPQTREGNMATIFVREEMAPGDRLRQLADFASLPLLAQRILEGRSSYSPTTALVLSNSHRAQPYYPTEEGGVRPIVEAFNAFATTIIFTIPQTPHANARDVDYLFRLSEEPSESGVRLRATCVQGAPPGQPGLFSVGLVRDVSALIEMVGRS